MRFFRLLLLFVLFTGMFSAFPAVSPSAQTPLLQPPVTNPRQPSAEDQAKFDRRKENILAELKRLPNHEWAGEYELGDGLGLNVELCLAPQSGFAFYSVGCNKFAFDIQAGTVEWLDGKIRLRPTLPKAPDSLFSESRTYYPVRWGARRYLIGEDEMITFANRVNQSLEPETGMFRNHSLFLVREKDRSKKPKGRPTIPAEFRHYLLKQPIHAKVIAVGPSKTKQVEDVSGLWERFTEVTLDAGSARGVFVGMEFTAFHPRRVYASGQVTQVESDRCMVLIEESLTEEKPLPATNWVFSTSLNR
jgi:hypothetical protein